MAVNKKNDNKSVEDLYSEYIHGLSSSMSKDDFCTYFARCIKAGKKEMSVTKRTVERRFDGEWLDIIEASVIPIDNIIRNPKSYIKNLEDIVSIEMARGITDESIVHLAQHTDMIAKIDEDGMVTPDRILNITKEESFDTYENRFIYTLLTNLDYFIMRRLNMMKHADNDIIELSFKGEGMLGKERISYKMQISCEGVNSNDDIRDELMNIDVTTMTAFQRLERLRKILNEFKSSFLMRELKGCALVRPPLHMTNVLLKNPDFVQAVALWNFISGYGGDKIEAVTVESTVVPSGEFTEQISSVLPLQYSIVKHHFGGRLVDVPDVNTEEASLRTQIELFAETAGLDLRQAKAVFNEIFDRKISEQDEEKLRARRIAGHILSKEEAWLEKEQARLERKKQQLAERARLEEEKAKRAADYLKQQRLNQIEYEGLERKRLEEERQKQLEDERIERLVMARLVRYEKEKAEAAKALAAAEAAAEAARADAELARSQAEAVRAEADAARAEAEERLAEAISRAEETEAQLAATEEEVKPEIKETSAEEPKRRGRPRTKDKK